MCGRFYIDEDTATQIRSVVEELDRKKIERMSFHGDVCPSNKTVLIYGSPNNQESPLLQSGLFQWGFMNKDNKLIINARAETLQERPMFQKAIETKRCVVPATGFYEWKKNTREKYYFSNPEEKVIYLAGIYRFYEGEGHFVILTKPADDVMEPVHDRMPVIFTQNTWRKWIVAPKKEATEMIFGNKTSLTKQKEGSQFEQMKIF